MPRPFNIFSAEKESRIEKWLRGGRKTGHGRELRGKEREMKKMGRCESESEGDESGGLWARGQGCGAAGLPGTEKAGRQTQREG